VAASRRSDGLENIPFTSHHKRINEGRLHGTGKWVFERQEYCAWISSPTSMLLNADGLDANMNRVMYLLPKKESVSMAIIGERLEVTR
jgi:hypothetical protein